ncbi:MAG: hypothetical protein R3Y59_10655 [bacterium]
MKKRHIILLSIATYFFSLFLGFSCVHKLCYYIIENLNPDYKFSDEWFISQVIKFTCFIAAIIVFFTQWTRVRLQEAILIFFVSSFIGLSHINVSCLGEVVALIFIIPFFLIFVNWAVVREFEHYHDILLPQIGQFYKTDCKLKKLIFANKYH